MAYIFEPDTLGKIAKGVVGMSHADMTRTVIDELARAYPGHVETKQDWFFNLAGGAVGVMTVLHGSLSEYVILFGSPVGIHGFSGRYRIEIFDWMIAGEMWTFTEDKVSEKVVTKPGEMAHLRSDQVKGFRLPDGAWMLEYGRGPIPTALPFALSDAFISCLDTRTVLKTLWVYGKLVTRELLHGKI